MTIANHLRLAILSSLFAVCISTTACHYDRDTAGKPGMETGEGKPGSVTASKEGTGDPKVGEGRGEVGTDAPQKPEREPAR